MSKELPFFKFNPEQWLSGRISLEPFDIQGVFINVCAVFWANSCQMKIATLKKRYGVAIDSLIAENFIKEDANGMAKIDWLYSEFKSCYKIHKTNQKNGKAGAHKRWALHSEANSPAISQPNSEPIPLREDKIKRRIRKEFVPPSILEVKEYFKTNGYTELVAEKAFNSYAVANWIDSQGKPVLNWKQKMINVWFRDEHKIPSTVRPMVR